ncbi:MAG: hypothetical protein MUE83_11040 [Tabrizicola sp.]|jgi:hypothetical protein|nr:hypothetical protein [Tabrizicola sp.]
MRIYLGLALAACSGLAAWAEPQDGKWDCIYVDGPPGPLGQLDISGSEYTLLAPNTAPSSGELVQEADALRVGSGILLDTYGVNGVTGMVDKSNPDAFADLLLSSVGTPVASCQPQK